MDKIKQKARSIKVMHHPDMVENAGSNPVGLIKCPKCKEVFDMSEAIKQIKKQAISDYTEEIIKLLDKKK